MEILDHLMPLLVALITATGAAIGTIYGFRKANSIWQYRIEELTREVREHNNFARRMPVIEEKIKVINHRLDDLEAKSKE